jgi:hypothetical protein
LALLLISAPAGLASPAAEEAAGDPRSVVRLELDCASDLGRRAVTLFANGTVRLREGLSGQERVHLAELSPEERDGYLARLAAEDLGETDPRALGPDGEWVERCSLDLHLPERGPQRFRFVRYGSLSLALSRVLAVAQELGARVEAVRAGGHHLPARYAPRRGDVLERRDGSRFRVERLTADKRGVELRGLDQPLVLYVSLDDLAGEFVALVEEREP